MKFKPLLSTLLIGSLVLAGCGNQSDDASDKDEDSKNSTSQQSDKQSQEKDKDKQYSNISYPKDGVKGIYVAPGNVTGDNFDELIDFINDTELNAMVIDVKDDEGDITIDFHTDDKLIQKNTVETIDAKKLIKEMEKNDIYPIARVVTFKDSKLSEEKPEWSFKDQNGEVWQSDGGDSFLNPFEEKVWDYDMNVAEAAAKAGFKDIQFDYVRFPEGFENQDSELQYSKGKYKDSDMSSTDQRVDTITKFLEQANKKLDKYNVQTSADVFGYAATVEETPGIGQSFNKIAKNVDAISSMIYPSHWSPGDFGLDAPDLEPYKTVDNYLDKETDLLDDLGKNKPKSRPWLQDFTASYLGEGQYKEYNAQEVQDQIQALKNHGIDEFLLWDASNEYSEGVDYTPEKQTKDKDKNNDSESNSDSDDNSDDSNNDGGNEQAESEQ
ncbi:putative glycoside hydrolase [Staphylococcus auricularis]|uniref:putative glycoside hydrolase n=1 Tax=Staphylococcus auricularis TaxID=29379 RepID=UPI002431F357|nr:putative glycoside hydrolase [Staphylococcus auricularis]